MNQVTTLSTLLFIGAVGMVTSAALRGQSSRPGGADNAWDPKWFDYDRPAKLVVEETTPTADQINFWHRPQQEASDAPAPRATGRATPATVGGLSIVHLRFRDADGNVVPALLCTPRDKKGPFPLIIATHGYTSNKAQVCAQVAPTLTARGFAVLAADMPAHGERPGANAAIMDRSDWSKSSKLWREGIIDVRQLIDLAEARSDLDTKNGVILVGYSMGSWISSVAGPADPRVKAMALMVGGAANIPAAALRLPQVAANDPRLSIKHFAGRPILMLNGHNDFIVTAPMTQLLWDAAPEPKEQLWYDSGHLLPAQAYDDAADWIAKTWKQVEKKPPAAEPSR